MNPLADASAHKVATTLERTIVPDPIPADAEKVLPYELAKYEANGYGAWSYGPGLAAERRLDLMPAGYDGTAAGGVAGSCASSPSPTSTSPTCSRRPRRSSSATRAFSRRPTRGSCCTRTTCSTRPCRRSTPCTGRSRSTSASPWATRATTPSTTSCAGTSTCSTASASTPTPGSRTGRLPGRGPRSSTPTTRPASTRRSPGTRCAATTTTSGRGSSRVDDYLRKTYVGEEILDLGNVFEDPRGPDSRGFYMGCLDGRTPYGDIIGIGPVADFADAAQGPRGRPRPPLADEERVDERVLHDVVEPQGARLRRGRPSTPASPATPSSPRPACRSGSSRWTTRSATTIPTTTATGTSRWTRSGTTGSSASWTGARPTACS